MHIRHRLTILGCSFILFCFIATNSLSTSTAQALTISGNANQISAGILVSDGQFVYGPNVGDFQLEAYLLSYSSRLATYSQKIYGQAKYYSINPRLYLALMEMSTGLLSQGENANVEDPFELEETGFLPQMDRISTVMTEAYYLRLYPSELASTATGGLSPLKLRDGTLVEVDPGTNAGTYAVYSALALLFDAEGFSAAIDPDHPDGFLSTYRTLFPQDDPLSKTNQTVPLRTLQIMSVLPANDLLQFPYLRGQAWTFNGTHNSDGSSTPTDMSSIDFSPNWPNWNVDTSTMWVAAAADGTPYRWSDCGFSIVHANGWETFYYHLESIPTTFGSTIHQNDTIGVIANTIPEALCTGGSSTGPHVHFSLRYNGQLVPIDGMLISGWSIHSGRYSYDSNHSYMWLERNGLRAFAYNYRLLNDTHFFSGVAAPASPLNNTLIAGNFMPTLDWNDVPGAAAYAVQISSDPLFSTLAVNRSNIATSTYTVEAPLASNTTYYWRIQSFNAAGDGGIWSTVGSFRTAFRPPNLVAPSAAQHILTLRPTFDWSDVLETGVTGYTIQISTSNTFSTIVQSANTATSSYTPGSDLPKGWLYWRVQTLGANGPSSWSEVRSYQGPNPPPITLLGGPFNGRQLLNPTGTGQVFSWLNVALPAGTTLKHYQFQLASSTVFTSPIVNVTIVANSYVPATVMTSNTVYYWRVRAVNTMDEPGEWSDTWSLSLPPITPTLVTPANGAKPNSLQPAFDWTDVTGTGYYTIQVARDTAFMQLVVNESSLPSTFSPTMDLPYNSVFFWRVRAEGAGGSGNWSAVRTFTTPTPPGIPALFSPNRDATVANYQPLFKWNPVSVPRGTQFDHYQIQVGTDQTFSAPAINVNISGVTTTVYTPAITLTANTKYYWRMRAYNTISEFSSWSEVRTFTTPAPINDHRPGTAATDPAIPLPEILSPTRETSLDSLQPVLDWNNVTGATSYIVQISTEPGFTTFLVSATTVDSQYTFLQAAPSGATLYWRILVVSGNRIGNWSVPSQFTLP